jgi:hypothetical protein
MTVERPCDCAGHHMHFPERDPDAVTWELLHPPTGRIRLQLPVPDMHQHEDGRCSDGCPGLPHCRDWIIGSYRVGEALARVMGDGDREFKIRIARDGLEREFALRKPLEAP